MKSLRNYREAWHVTTMFFNCRLHLKVVLAIDISYFEMHNRKWNAAREGTIYVHVYWTQLSVQVLQFSRLLGTVNHGPCWLCILMKKCKMPKGEKNREEPAAYWRKKFWSSAQQPDHCKLGRDYRSYELFESERCAMSILC